MKQCSKCSVSYELPADNFYRDVRSKDGFTSQCHRCFARYAKTYNAKKKKKRSPRTSRHRGKWPCVACGNMPHRVEGSACALCGLTFSPDIVKATEFLVSALSDSQYPSVEPTLGDYEFLGQLRQKAPKKCYREIMHMHNRGKVRK